ncbi:MAG: HAD hydrolase-like protein [Bacteroidales bacterium]
MNKSIPTTLFLDIGGVLLSNGWGHESRKLASKAFDLDFDDMEERHHLTFVTYEEGKLTMSEYFKRVVFYRKRDFTPDQFRDYMFAQSTPFTEMIEFMRKLKEKNCLRVAVVNNEARELNEYRIRKFKLNRFVDFYISSCFVHFRKPDADIFRIALDIAQIPAEHVVYIENTQMFVDVARDLGIRSIFHKDYLSTYAELEAMGLKMG